MICFFSVNLFVFFTCYCCCGSSVGAHIESNIETNCLNLVENCQAQPNSDIDNTFAFVSCQNKLESTNGGCIFVPDGKYPIYNVQLNTSNTIVYINSSVTFIPYITTTTKNSEALFNVGSETKFVQNVSLIGININTMDATQPLSSLQTPKNQNADFSDNFLIDLGNRSLVPLNGQGIRLVGVDKFLLSNIDIQIEANISNQHAAIEFDHNNVNGIIYHAKNGQVLNINSSDYTYGYGTVQIQSGENIMFENLDGTGGVTLRLETGAGDQNGYVNNITGNNIICRNGHAALFAQPHTQQNGVFKVYNMVSYGCYIGAELNGGYSQDNKPPGHFSNDSIVSSVVAYWGPDAQIFAQHTQNISIFGPSCGPCGTETSKLNYIITVSGLESHGFPTPSNRSKCAYWTKYPLPTVCPWDNSSISLLV